MVRLFLCRAAGRRKNGSSSLLLLCSFKMWALSLTLPLWTTHCKEGGKGQGHSFWSTYSQLSSMSHSPNKCYNVAMLTQLFITSSTIIWPIKDCPAFSKVTCNFRYPTRSVGHPSLIFRNCWMPTLWKLGPFMVTHIGYPESLVENFGHYFLARFKS